jgi:hypothetical protein
MEVLSTLFRFNWFDWAVVGLVCLYAWQGWERGLYIVIPEFIAWIMAWVIGLIWAEPFAIILINNFGLWRQSSWLWAFMMLVIVTELICYQLGELIFLRLPKRYLPKSGQLTLAVIPAFLSGLMLMSFLVLIGVKLPVRYSMDEQVDQSWFGQSVTNMVIAGHGWFRGENMNMGLQ